ncbi:MAG: methionyl-tRNA formyltransferase [Beijerinckiaceae bacterium]|jgi:methionyl-tRNA formyltransferase
MAFRVVFMGTPQYSAPVLQSIVDDGHNVVAVYTRAPQPAGRRGLALTRSPVHELADKLGLPVHTPRSLRSEEEAATMRAHAADVAIVVAYGLILPRPVLDAPRLGCLNLHASLLPRWRGAAPIQRAIMAGDTETGVMLMQMEEGLDTGPVGLVARTPIEPNLTAGELHDRLSGMSAQLAVEGLRRLAEGGLTFTPQAQEDVVYAHKIDKGETRIDWSRDAASLHDHIRALSPFPGAWCELDNGRSIERVKILRTTLKDSRGSEQAGAILDDELTVAAGDGALRVLELQRAGKTPVSAADFLRGFAQRPARFQ